MRGLLALAGLTFVLSACAASEPSPPSSSPTTTIATTTSTPPPDTSTDRYLDALEDLLSETGFADSLDEADDLFVAVGERMCRLLDVGLTVDDLLTVSVATASAAEEDGENLALGGLVLGAAVAELCPRHLDLLDVPG